MLAALDLFCPHQFPILTPALLEESGFAFIVQLNARGRWDRFSSSHSRTGCSRGAGDRVLDELSAFDLFKAQMVTELRLMPNAATTLTTAPTDRKDPLAVPAC